MRKYKELLQLYKHPFTLIRLGKQSDGGYVVPKELINNNLLSAGISNEISFEEDYLKYIQKPNIHCFDGTIQDFPSKIQELQWHKLNIGSCDNNNEISLNTIFNKYFKNEVFIKMDIEEAEYKAFESITNENLQKINCLVLEIHWIDKLYDYFEKLMYKLNTELILIHKHDNNCGLYFTYDNKTIPNVYELTFVNKKYIKEKIKNDIKLPIKNLDFPNSYLESKVVDY